MADGIRATPRQNQILGLLADRLKQAQQFGAKPFGYENPPVEMLMNLLGVPAVQQTLERMSYGEPLTTGRGMTTQVRPETVEAAMTLLPMAAGAAKATKGLPVGASIKNIDELAKKYPDVIIDASVNKNDINLSRIVVPKEMRNKGVGTQVMEDLSQFADSIGKRITLTPSSEFGGSVPKLKTFYKELGFVENKGKNKDFSTREAMYREPQPVQQSAQFEYPQEEAMRLAQQRAALPVEQGGLGLPANNTAEQRAAAMGFDKDIYHGSQNEISSIDFSRAGQNTGNPNATLGFFTTPNPQEGSRYATLHGNQINANVMPLRAKSSNSYEMPYKELDDMAMSPYNLMMADPNFNPNAIVKFGDMAAQKAAAERLQKYNKAASEQSLQRKKELMQEGFDSATVLPGKSMEEFIVFNPDIIRSRFAAFDPFRKTAATAALMGVAAPDLLAQEVDYTLLPPEKKKELLQSLLGQ